MDLTTLLVFWSVPGAVTGIGVWWIQRNLTKREKRREKQDEARKRNELLLIRLVGATVALGEATARSVQRLDAQANGEMTRALDYVEKMKHEQKDFLQEQGIENLF